MDLYTAHRGLNDVLDSVSLGVDSILRTCDCFICGNILAGGELRQRCGHHDIVK